ncbi:MAG: glycosyltransferase family 2 protein [Bacteroidales bacterium]|nr:glycosyltransferase family 2 protein [Bacteroidales bacterium]
MKSSLTVIIPAFNEEESIENTILNLLPVCRSQGWQILAINDGSVDQTPYILKKFEEKKDIKVINQPFNKGYGSSLKAGIISADTDLVAFYDADGQNQPNDLVKMYESFGNNDMLVGERGKDSHQEWVRKPGKWILSKTANFLTGRTIPDLNSGLRIAKKDIIKKMLSLFPDGFSFSTTSTIAFFNLGYNVGYYPIKINKRIGKSTVKHIKDGSNILLLILRLIVLFNPLKVFIPMSFSFIFIGLIYELLAGIILHPTPPKFISGAFFIMISGILIFFFGLMVDQLSELRKNLLFKNEG